MKLTFLPDSKNILLDDCIKLVKVSLVYNIKSKITKRELINSCQKISISNKKQNKKLNNINNIKNDYNKGLLPTFYKLGGFLSKKKNKGLLPNNILFINKYIVILSIKKYIIIIFRKTSELFEWYNNLDLHTKRINITDKDEFNNWKKDFITKNKDYYKKIDELYPKDYLLHKGLDIFYEKYKFSEIIRSNIKKSGIENPFIIYSGTSRGGALSIIASLDIVTYYPNINFSILTYSTPPVLNSNLCLYLLYLSEKKKILKNFIRVFNSKDLLIHMKTRTWVGEKIHLSKIWNKNFGTLYHPTSMIPDKYKSIISDSKKNINTNFTDIDCYENLEKKIEHCNDLKKLVARHVAYSFSRKKNSLLMSY
jgi:hypothetical protein